MSVFSRTVDEKIGWNRIGAVISVVVIAVSLVVLYRLLQNIEFGKVTAALAAMPLSAILTAGVFVAASYVTLTFYDFFSLRTIGRDHVPYRIAALAAFTSYSIGHNLGATVFTGGAIRFRIYSAWGLGVIDVAKIAFVTGLTFWLGNVCVLGLAVAYAPDAAAAVSQLPPWVNRALALAALACVGGYLLWLLPKPRVVGRDSWKVVLPSARLTLVQIGIGITDLGLGSLAMYSLLPSQPAVGFADAVATFVVATLLGFLSHAPGSLGVFDAAMLLGLPQFAKEELLAMLLVFRLLYFVLPFSLALVTLGIRELMVSMAASKSRDSVDP